MDNVSIGEVIALSKVFGGGGGSSGGGVLYVTASQGTGALDKNFEEIQTALDGGKVVMLKRESPSDGVFYAPLFKTASFPEDHPYRRPGTLASRHSTGTCYGVTFYDFSLAQEVTFSNATSPTDPLVYEE